METVKINDIVYSQGDYVIIKVERLYEDPETGLEIEDVEEVFSRLYIENKGRENYLDVYFCQNVCEGAYPGEWTEEGPNLYGFSYSWTAIIRDDKISTSDTISVRPALLSEIKKFLKELPTEESSIKDDDPMPKDWVLEEDLPF